MIVEQAIYPSQLPVEGNIRVGGSAGSNTEAFKGAFSQLLTATLPATVDQPEPDLQMLIGELQELMNLVEGMTEEGTGSLASELRTDAELQALLKEKVNQDELMQYLDQLSQLIAALDNLQSNMKGEQPILLEQYEQLNKMFQQIPLQKIESAAFYPSRTGSPRSDNTLVSALEKWNILLQATLAANQKVISSKQAEAVAQEAPLIQQVKSIIAELNQNDAWKNFLREKIKLQETASIVHVQGRHFAGETTLRIPSFLPPSLLKQWKEGQTVLSLAQQEVTPTLTQQSNTLSQQQESEFQALMNQTKAAELTALSRTGEASAPTVRFSHLFEDIQGILKQQLQFKQGQEGSQIRLKLYPEHLGHLDIKITAVEGKIYAQLMTSNQMAKEALEFSVGQLRMALQQQGLQVDRIEITQQQQQTGLNHSWQDQRDGQAFAQHQNQQKNSAQATYDEVEQSIEDLDSIQEEQNQSIDLKA